MSSLSGERFFLVSDLGKYQLALLSNCSHAVHEDAPEEVARIINSFVDRHLTFRVPARKNV